MYDRIERIEPMKSMLKPREAGGRTTPEWVKFDSLDETRKIMKARPMSNQHPCGTCAMLPKVNGGVVDTRLRVYGVQGLRVCDASIMPLITRGNIMSSVYAIAEKCVDMIREDLHQD